MQGRPAAPRAAGAFYCEAATTKAKKTEQLAALREKFDPAVTTFVAGVNYKGMTARCGPVILGLSRTAAWPGGRRWPALPAWGFQARAPAFCVAVAPSLCALRARQTSGTTSLRGGSTSPTRKCVAAVCSRGTCSPPPPPRRQVKDFETFRKKLPAGVQLVVAKNTLIEKAIEGTRFEPLKQACKGTNAFLFSGEEVGPRRAPAKPTRGHPMGADEEIIGPAPSWTTGGPCALSLCPLWVALSLVLPPQHQGFQ